MILSRSPLLSRQKMRQGDAPLIRVAIEDESQQIVTSAQVQSLAYQIWDTTSNTAEPTLLTQGTLTVGAVWYDSWQPWEDDTIGFNFAYRFPASLFATAEKGNRQFKIEVRGVAAFTNEPFWAAFMLVDAEDALSV